MSDFVLDASLALQWFLEDETDRQYSLQVLNSIAESRAFVPQLWFYEIGNGLLMAYRRKRITLYCNFKEPGLSQARGRFAAGYPAA